MQLIITDAANSWFVSHYGLNDGDGIKVFGKTVQPRKVRHEPQQGFTPEDDLTNAIVVEKKNGINYHINFEDGWFFSGLVTKIDYHNGAEQPLFYFERDMDDQIINEQNFTAEDVDATTGASSKFEDYWE